MSDKRRRGAVTRPRFYLFGVMALIACPGGPGARAAEGERVSPALGNATDTVRFSKHRLEISANEGSAVNKGAKTRARPRPLIRPTDIPLM